MRAQTRDPEEYRWQSPGGHVCNLCGKSLPRWSLTSKCVTKFEISKLLDATLTIENIREIKAAEELAKRFLTWDIDPDSEDVIEVLQKMIEATDIFLEEDTSIYAEGSANRQNVTIDDDGCIDSSEGIDWGFPA